MVEFVVGGGGGGANEELAGGAGDEVTDCRCFITDSLSRRCPGQLFGLWCVQNSTVNIRDSRFLLVQAPMIE
jgi:hypothetical protein